MRKLFHLKSTRIFQLLILAIALFLFSGPANAQKTIPNNKVKKLSVGQTLSDSLTSTEKHSYTIDLPAGQFVYGEVDQHYIDVTVNVYCPDNTIINTFNIPKPGPETFHFITETAGNFRLVIKSDKKDSGKYTVKIERSEQLAKTKEERVDQFMTFYNGKDVPGGVIAVVTNGNIEFAKGYGMANLEYNVPNKPQTPYHIASVSKQFTAFAIAMLANRGELSLDDNLRTYIPELYNYSAKITLRHLLTHTSGLRDQWGLWAMSGGRMDDVIRQEDLFRLIMNQHDLNFTPGSEYLYSNTGYMLLAEIVERVTGVEFGIWMENYIFSPLEMNSTQIYDDHERIVEGRAYSYQYGRNSIKKEVLSYANYGATSVFTTAIDLAKWLHNFDVKELGGPQVFDQMQERGVLISGDTLNYALGIVIGVYRGLRRIQHGGADAGYRTMLTYYPEINAGIIVLSNIASFNVTRTTNEVSDLFFAEHMTQKGEESFQDAETGNTVAKELLHAYEGSYQTENGLIIHLMKEENTLFAQIGGKSYFPLIAITDTLFQFTGIEASISFKIQDNGTIKRGTIYQNGDTPFRRIEKWSPSSEELSAYTGKYYSPELKTYYTISNEDGQFKAWHLRHGDIELTPKRKDHFEGDIWFFDDIDFMRDSTGAVTSMRVSNGRVRNLLFKKQVLMN